MPQQRKFRKPRGKPPAEFTKFEALTRSLVRVPKDEIDAEREKAEKAKRDR
jgi:hypothetical protein